MQFFFYGTLQAGSDNPVARMVHALLEPLGAAQVAGALYAVPDPDGWYPALLPGTDVVHGQLYRAGAGFDAAALERMDAYEDFRPGDPAGSLYVRGEAALLDGGVGAAAPCRSIASTSRCCLAACRCPAATFAHGWPDQAKQHSRGGGRVRLAFRIDFA